MIFKIPMLLHVVKWNLHLPCHYNVSWINILLIFNFLMILIMEIKQPKQICV
jgi:hypothetical protein